MTLNKKLKHKTVKAHYIAYKSMDDIYLRIDDNRVTGCLYRECSYTENFFQPRLVSRFYGICHTENKNLFFNKYAAICK